MISSIQIDQISGTAQNIPIASGSVIFLVGANGTGKSSLAHKIAIQDGDSSYISAHRQSWIQQIELNQSVKFLDNFHTVSRQRTASTQARYKDNTAQDWATQNLSKLYRHERIQKDRSHDLARSGKAEAAFENASQATPFEIISNLLQNCGLPLNIFVEDDTFRAEKVVGSEVSKFDIDQLSDGERNAIQIIAATMNAKSDSLVVLDEPEKHLHRSITTKLVESVISLRPDCSFVVSTHELGLPMRFPDAIVVCVAKCEFSGNTPVKWETHTLNPSTELPEQIKRDILGSRNILLFVEGEEGSLDRKLYEALFPGVTVVPKETCKNVEQAVRVTNSTQSDHWVQAFGIIDNDNRDASELNTLKADGIYALPAYSIESLYLDPNVMGRAILAATHIPPDDKESRLKQAMNAILESVNSNAAHLINRVVERKLRTKVIQQLPTHAKLSSSPALSINIDITSLWATEQTILAQMIDAADISGIVKRYPIRESGALSAVSKAFGYSTVREFSTLIANLVATDAGIKSYLGSMFSELHQEMEKVTK